MRFKFRAWDKEKKVLMPVKLMDFSEWWVSCSSIGEDEPLAFGERNSFNNEQTDRHILMQYTGLKDKNGKEIYEGDIVKYTDTSGRVSNLVVEWYESDACFVFGWVRTDYARAFGEVIGNIYENPELR